MQLYKRLLLCFAQTLLTVFALVSCIADKFDGDNGGEQRPKADNGIIYVKLFTSDGTRADSGDLMPDDGTGHDSGDLVNGSDAEHAIGMNGNYIILFDEEEKFFGVSPLTLTTDDQFPHDGHQREKVYGARIRADEETEMWPSWCLVVLNGEPMYSSLLSEENLKDKSIAEVQQLFQSAADDDPYTIGRYNDYFVMTNAVCQIDGEVRTAVEIPEDLIQQGAIIDESKILYIHVERMVAKFDFRIEYNEDLQPFEERLAIYRPSKSADVVLFDGFEADGSPKYVAKRWQIEVTGWGINALEKESYLFKQIKEGNYFSGWNDAANYRTYWSEDRTYTDARYPWQYRSPGYESAANVPYYSAAGADAAGVTMLKNYAFNAPETNLEKKDDAETAQLHFDRVIYAPESTYKAEAVADKHDDRDEMLAATHLLVGAELQIEMDRINDPDQYTTTNLYRERSGFFYLTERDCFAAQIHAFNQLLNSQRSMNYVYYKWDKSINDNSNNRDETAAKPAEIETSPSYGNNPVFHLYWEYNGRYEELNDQFFNVVCRTQADFESLFGSLAIGELPGGDGQRLPWPTKGTLHIRNSNRTPVDIYTRDIETEGEAIHHERLRPANENDVKSLLYEWIGAIDHFNNGRMYYACGIEQAAGAAVNTTGRYGVVRNNWYQFNLKSISGLGVPVDDPDQVIVPDRAGPSDQINVSVTILDWHFEERTLGSVNGFGNTSPTS